MNQELKRIKRLFGEDMMHLCRELFPTILENEGCLLEILKSKFIPSKFLYDDIINDNATDSFKDFIYTTYLEMKSEKQVLENATLSPKELMEKAGYDLYECKTEADIQSFRHYYYRKGKTPVYNGVRPELWQGEELCTFNGGRLDKCHVFFAVKKNVDEIKREDFKHPRREDDYGVSVISIQFTKGDTNTVSVKNRYNHTVANPDATFSNNLDNIISGLTASFSKYYGLNIIGFSNTFEISDYVLSSDSKYYKFNQEINNIYYCTDNIIIDNFNTISTYYDEKEKYIVADYFIIDLYKKKIEIYDSNISDSFIDDFHNIKNITVKNCDDGEKEIEITKADDTKTYITIDRKSRIIKYVNNSVRMIDGNFLMYNDELKSLSLLSVEKIGDNFLAKNNSLKVLYLPCVKTIGNYFLRNSEFMTAVDLPCVERIGDSFISGSRCLDKINLPCIKSIGDSFLFNAVDLKEINIESVRTIGKYFLHLGYIKEINLPNVRYIDDGFMGINFGIAFVCKITVPQDATLSPSFISACKKMEESGKKILYYTLPARTEDFYRTRKEEK